MTRNEFMSLRNQIVLLVKAVLTTGSVVEEMAFTSGKVYLSVTPCIYEKEADRYRLIDKDIQVTAAIDQYVGCFSDDGRLEMFGARVKAIDQDDHNLLSFLTGERICVCFDSLISAGCIESTKMGDGWVSFAMPGFLAEHNFDGDPVERLESTELNEFLAQQTAETVSKEPEPTAMPEDTAATAEAATKSEYTPTGPEAVAEQSVSTTPEGAGEAVASARTEEPEEDLGIG